MSAKYKVNVWKTKVYRTTIEVIAPNRNKAAALAQAQACYGENVSWDFIDAEIEADTPVSGEYFE